jgi:AhpD family alkylhydroperoxidase
MKREEVYKQMEQALGLVPTFFKSLPDSSLELEWTLFNRLENEPGPIPNKYRELVGLGVAAALKCPYCAMYHTEMAKLNGATDAEIEDAVHFVKFSVGWSAYLNGLQSDIHQFRDELKRIVAYQRKKATKETKAA